MREHCAWLVKDDTLGDLSIPDWFCVVPYILSPNGLVQETAVRLTLFVLFHILIFRENRNDGRSVLLTHEVGVELLMLELVVDHLPLQVFDRQLLVHLRVNASPA